MSAPTSPPPDPLPPDENKGIILLALTCTLTSIAIVMTALRCWVRRVYHQLGWDDYLIAITTLLAVARMGLQIVGVKHGNGRHIWYLSDQQYEWIVRSSWYTQLILFPAICLLKISICLLLLRIFSTRAIEWWLYAMMAGLVITNLEPIIVLLAECSPIKTYWEPEAGTCWSPQIRIYSIYVQVGASQLPSPPVLFWLLTHPEAIPSSPI